jgi:hypothetical protein
MLGIDSQPLTTVSPARHFLRMAFGRKLGLGVGNSDVRFTMRYPDTARAGYVRDLPAVGPGNGYIQPPKTTTPFRNIN